MGPNSCSSLHADININTRCFDERNILIGMAFDELLCYYRYMTPKEIVALAHTGSLVTCHSQSLQGQDTSLLCNREAFRLDLVGLQYITIWVCIHEHQSVCGEK